VSEITGQAGVRFQVSGVKSETYNSGRALGVLVGARSLGIHSMPVKAKAMAIQPGSKMFIDTLLSEELPGIGHLRPET
jgi:hypothetical protein